MKRLAIISNMRMLLIFLLINDKELKDIGFILEENVKIKKLERVYIIPNNKNIIDLFINKIKLYFLFCILKRKWNFNKKMDIFGADHINGSNYFLKRFNFYLLEDGTINYKAEVYIRSIKNILFSKPKFGVYKNVKKIYLTGLAPIPSKIEKKVEIINLNKLWRNKTIKEKERILEIFGFNNKIIKSIEKRSLILYTQPLSEDGILTEKEKIELYYKIILKYPKEKLILKTHPREITKYENFFKGIEILKENFPAEIFSLLGIEFQKGITIFSTAVLDSAIKEIDFYGTEVHPKLYEKFGSCDSIMKRNAFL